VRAPRLEGVFGKPVPIQIPRPGVPLEKIPATTIIADTKYIHDSIMLPEKQVRGGFRPIMPTFKKRVTEEEILKIVAYIKSLSDKTPTENTSQTPTTALGAEDYRSRTGFVPTNIKGLK
jgi:cytochrome c oxidase subunit 2